MTTMTKDEIKKALEACGAINSPCVDCPYKNVEDCYDTLKNDALVLITEQEREIEQLKDGYARVQEQLRVQELFAKYQIVSDKEIKARRKQGQIDVLNKVRDYVNNKIENDCGDMSDSVHYYTIDIDEFDDFIDELLTEVQNEN